MSAPAALAAADVLEAYRQGWFPMAQSRGDSRVYWISPDVRGVLPLPTFHIPRRLARTCRQKRFQLSVDTAFPAVIDACGRSDPSRDRTETWINPSIRAVFLDLHRAGHAHSVECWRDGVLAGGLYGLAVNGAFFGESMFSTARDASKVALVHLVHRLRAGGFTLLDAQFENDHLDQFGQERVLRAAFRMRLAAALMQAADFYRLGPPGPVSGDQDPAAWHGTAASGDAPMRGPAHPEGNPVSCLGDSNHMAACGGLQPRG